MVEEDEEKIVFITNRGLYYYKGMPFGLKNVEATYQRLVNKIFTDQLGKNMEAYMDDMLIKSKNISQHIVDLEKTFSILRRHGMRLNSTKCAIEVALEKFLGFIVSHRGIEVDPKKIRAVLDLSSPRTVKEIQSLAWRIVMLSRFVSRLAKWCLPFFKALS